MTTCTPPTKTSVILGRSLLHTEVVGMSSLAAGIAGRGRGHPRPGRLWHCLDPLRQGGGAARLRFRGMVEVPYWEAKAEGTCRNSVDRYRESAFSERVRGRNGRHRGLACGGRSASSLIGFARSVRPCPRRRTLEGPSRSAQGSNRSRPLASMSGAPGIRSAGRPRVRRLPHTPRVPYYVRISPGAHRNREGNRP